MSAAEDDVAYSSPPQLAPASGAIILPPWLQSLRTLVPPQLATDPEFWRASEGKKIEMILKLDAAKKDFSADMASIEARLNSGREDRETAKRLERDLAAMEAMQETVPKALVVAAKSRAGEITYPSSGALFVSYADFVAFMDHVAAEAAFVTATSFRSASGAGANQEMKTIPPMFIFESVIGNMLKISFARGFYGGPTMPTAADMMPVAYASLGRRLCPDIRSSFAPPANPPSMTLSLPLTVRQIEESFKEALRNDVDLFEMGGTSSDYPLPEKQSLTFFARWIGDAILVLAKRHSLDIDGRLEGGDGEATCLEREWRALVSPSAPSLKSAEGAIIPGLEITAEHGDAKNQAYAKGMLEAMRTMKSMQNKFSYLRLVELLWKRIDEIEAAADAALAAQTEDGEEETRVAAELAAADSSESLSPPFLMPSLFLSVSDGDATCATAPPRRVRGGVSPTM